MAGRAWRGISLVIPAWNEAGAVGGVLRQAVGVLRRLGPEFEILVVDDGSSDATAMCVELHALTEPRVRLIRHRRRLGYGAALRSGFERASYDLVAFTDGDGQFDLRDLARLVEAAAQADIVCGYRAQRQDGRWRRFLSWGYNALVRWLFGLTVRDVDCALKVFHRHCLASILPDSANFFVNTELLVRARLAGLRIVEMPVAHRPRRAGVSTVSLWDIPRTLAHLIPFWFRVRLGRVSRAALASYNLFARVRLPSASPTDPHAAAASPRGSRSEVQTWP
jgi:glycosyltransferase involved in cell wall biosynthesis